MKIGVLGSGDVGRRLAEGLVRHGHDVMMGTRDPAKLRDWAGRTSNVQVGSLSVAAQFGALAVLAVNGAAARDALRAAGARNLTGKIVIDVTNPIANTPPVNGVLSFFTNLNASLMEALQQEFPEVRFVKAFNQANFSRMVNPHFSEGRPTMFICGNDAAAKKTVTEILDQFGWDAEDMGGVEAARAIEPLCMLWAIRYMLRGTLDHAFKLLKSPDDSNRDR